MAKHNEVGIIGEKIVFQFLKNKGLNISETNYRKPYGEIDIVAREKNVVRFIEVKSVSYETDRNVSHEIFRPEENLHPQKLKRLGRVIQAYILSRGTGEWAFDLVCVYIDQKSRSAKVKWIKDIIIE